MSSYRELETALRRAGFRATRGKGSHCKWYHRESGAFVVLPDNHKGRAAPTYQQRRVLRAVERIGGDNAT